MITCEFIASSDQRNKQKHDNLLKFIKKNNPEHIDDITLHEEHGVRISGSLLGGGDEELETYDDDLTVLEICCIRGLAQHVSFLLEQEQIINKTETLKDALTYAVLNNHSLIVERLLKALPESELNQYIVEDKEPNQSYTSWTLALSQKNYDLFLIIIKKLEEIMSDDDYDELTEQIAVHLEANPETLLDLLQDENTDALKYIINLFSGDGQKMILSPLIKKLEANSIVWQTIFYDILEELNIPGVNVVIEEPKEKLNKKIKDINKPCKVNIACPISGELILNPVFLLVMNEIGKQELEQQPYEEAMIETLMEEDTPISPITRRPVVTFIKLPLDALSSYYQARQELTSLPSVVKTTHLSSGRSTFFNESTEKPHEDDKPINTANLNNRG